MWSLKRFVIPRALGPQLLGNKVSLGGTVSPLKFPPYILSLYMALQFLQHLLCAWTSTRYRVKNSGVFRATRQRFTSPPTLLVWPTPYRDTLLLKRQLSPDVKPVCPPLCLSTYPVTQNNYPFIPRHLPPTGRSAHL